MDLRQCYEILEVRSGASFDEVKQAYKDAVSVWHPDRFSGNIRLKVKAEKKLRQINEAYETLERHLLRQDFQGDKTKGEDSSGGGESESKAEAIAEMSTRFVLHACHFLVSAIKKRIDK